MYRQLEFDTDTHLSGIFFYVCDATIHTRSCTNVARYELLRIRIRQAGFQRPGSNLHRRREIQFIQDIADVSGGGPFTDDKFLDDLAQCDKVQRQGRGHILNVERRPVIQLAAASFLGEIQIYQGRLNCAGVIYEQVGGAWSSFILYRGLARIHTARGNLTWA